MTGVSLEVVGKAALQQRQGPGEGGEEAAALSTSTMEISGMAAMEASATTLHGPSLKFVGKAVVETRDGPSLEIIGRASVQSVSAVGSLQIIEKEPVHGSQDGHDGGRTRRMFRLSARSLCVVGAVIGCLCAALLIRFIYLWEQCLLKSGTTGWALARASAVLGLELGLFFMLVLVVLLVPRMIVTWTTALVFEYVLGVVVSGKIKRNQIVRNGSRKAKEISWLTLTSVVEEGNVVAAAVLLVSFATTAVLRSILKVE